MTVASPSPGPDAGRTPPSGTVSLVAEDPTLLMMTGEVDLAAVRDLRGVLGIAELDDGGLEAALATVTRVDMRSVSFADSSALSLLAVLVSAQRRSGRRLAVVGAQTEIRLLLDVSGMSTLVDLVP